MIIWSFNRWYGSSFFDCWRWRRWRRWVMGWRKSHRTSKQRHTYVPLPPQTQSSLHGKEARNRYSCLTILRGASPTAPQFLFGKPPAPFGNLSLVWMSVCWKSWNRTKHGVGIYFRSNWLSTSGYNISSSRTKVWKPPYLGSSIGPLPKLLCSRTFLAVITPSTNGIFTAAISLLQPSIRRVVCTSIHTINMLWRGVFLQGVQGRIL